MCSIVCYWYFGLNKICCSLHSADHFLQCAAVSLYVVCVCVCDVSVSWCTMKIVLLLALLSGKHIHFTSSLTFSFFLHLKLMKTENHLPPSFNLTFKETNFYHYYYSLLLLKVFYLHYFFIFCLFHFFVLTFPLFA